MSILQPRKYYIYKLRRSDSMEYVGTTDSWRIQSRMCAHRKSERFRDYQFECEILAESDTTDIFVQEEDYIRKHKTLHPHGLNKTATGKGTGPRDFAGWTTRGFKYSEESRRKMSESSKKRIRNTGWKHKPEVKLAWSKLRIGKCWKAPGLSREQWNALMELWVAAPSCVLVNSNGRTISYARAFAKRYATQFELTPNGLYNIVAGKLKVFKFPGEYPVPDSHTDRVSSV